MIPYHEKPDWLPDGVFPQPIRATYRYYGRDGKPEDVIAVEARHWSDGWVIRCIFARSYGYGNEAGFWAWADYLSKE